MSVDDEILALVTQAFDAHDRTAAIPKLALSVSEVCESLSVGESTVRGWVRDGLLPKVPNTDRTLIPTAALEQFVMSGGKA
jgi:excisionase family DNA binding protein